jgi:hypothetical protein
MGRRLLERRSAKSQVFEVLPIKAGDCGIIAPRRSNIAHLRRPWRAIPRQSTPEHPKLDRRRDAIIRSHAGYADDLQVSRKTTSRPVPRMSGIVDSAR